MNKGMFGHPSARAIRRIDAQSVRLRTAIVTCDCDFRKYGARAVLAAGLRLIPGNVSYSDVDKTVPGALYVRDSSGGNPHVWLRNLPAGDFDAVLEVRAMGWPGAAGENRKVGIWTTNTETHGGGNANLLFVDKYNASSGSCFAGIASGAFSTGPADTATIFAWTYPHNFIRVTRVSSTWSVSWSHDGAIWANAVTYTPNGTPDRIGFGTGADSLGSNKEIAFYAFRIWEPAMPPGALISLRSPLTARR